MLFLAVEAPVEAQRSSIQQKTKVRGCGNASHRSLVGYVIGKEIQSQAMLKIAMLKMMKKCIQ